MPQSKKDLCLFAAAYEHAIVDINRPFASLKYRVVINGKNKLILPNTARLPREKAELHDLATDPFEHNDLSTDRPQTIQQLTQEIKDWWTFSNQGNQNIGPEFSSSAVVRY